MVICINVSLDPHDQFRHHTVIPYASANTAEAMDAMDGE
jgi:hypothetical protein